jgi:hypothetical protein
MADVWIARVGVLMLGIVALAAVGAACESIADGREVPPFVAGLATSAVSTLGVVVIALTRPHSGGGGDRPTT